MRKERRMIQPQETPDDGARRARYAEYLAVYEGAQWEGLPRPGERRLVFNYARAFVKKAASYLVGKPVRVVTRHGRGRGSKRWNGGRRGSGGWRWRARGWAGG